MFNRKGERKISNRKPEYPIPEKNDEATSNNQNNPDKNVGKNSPQIPVNMAGHSAIVQDINEEGGERESGSWGFNEYEAREIGAVHWGHFVSQEDVQSEDNEEISDQEKFRENKVFVDLECETSQRERGNTQSNAQPN